MSVKSNDSLINKLHLFTRHLPDSSVLFSLLFLLSLAAGIVSVALINYHVAVAEFGSVFAAGILSGILVVLLPTLLTVLAIKLLRRYVRMKYLIFIALIGAMVYSLFIVLASAIYEITANYSLSTVIVLVGDASIYGWWFFVNKVVLGQKKRAVVLAFMQPVLNVLVYIAASTLIFTFSAPLSVLLVKLFVGILIFLIISYIILYIFDSPLKRNLGFGGIDAFSQVVQNWLFDIDMMVARPFGDKNFGAHSNIETHTIVLRRGNHSIKSILFAPFIHYGPVGSMGGSNFPYALERYAASKHNAPIFIMHSALNEDFNPVSSSQLSDVQKVLDSSVKGAKRVGVGGMLVSYSESAHNNARVSLLSINNVGIATFTRAPHITEDIAPEASRLFKELLGKNGDTTMLIDAHNSRYESAPAEELRGVMPNSRYMDDYVSAIKKLGKAAHTTKRLRVGVGSADIYSQLDNPIDLAPGNLNVIIFCFNGFKRAMVQFNANNVLPGLRNAIVKLIKRKYGIEAEVYTTDTHFVNSLERSASNVLGRSTPTAKILPHVERAMDKALADAENVEVFYKKDYIRNFHIWGPDVREKAYAVITSVMGLARILVPAIVIAGFIIASWIISLV